MKRKLNFKRSLGKAQFKLKKHSPELLVIGGCIGMTTAAIFACKATPKAMVLMEDHKKNISVIKEAKAENGELEGYSVKDYRKDIASEYAAILKDMTKSYGPSLFLGGASIACILTSNKIMRGRNTTLAAAYATANKSYKRLQTAVDAKYGADAAKNLKFGATDEMVEEIVTDKDGNQKKVKQKMKTRDGESEPISPYIVKYDNQRCRSYEPNKDFRDAFFDTHMGYLNQKLQSDGFLFLNDVYKDLGFELNAVGQYDGWIWQEGVTEDIVEFDVQEIFNKKTREVEVWIDFNPRENIVEYVFNGKMKKEKK